VHCEVCPVCTEVGLQETETEVMVGGAGVMVSVVVSALVPSWTDVACTSTVFGLGTVPGAV
jgi:hypothetical protein